MRAILFVILTALSMPAFAASPWVCMKDGKAVKIKGKGAKKKKKKCEAQGGTWEQQSDAAAAPAPKAPAEEFDSSSGW